MAFALPMSKQSSDRFFYTCTGATLMCRDFSLLRFFIYKSWWVSLPELNNKFVFVLFSDVRFCFCKVGSLEKG